MVQAQSLNVWFAIYTKCQIARYGTDKNVAMGLPSVLDVNVCYGQANWPHGCLLVVGNRCLVACYDDRRNNSAWVKCLQCHRDGGREGQEKG